MVVDDAVKEKMCFVAGDARFSTAMTRKGYLVGSRAFAEAHMIVSFFEGQPRAALPGALP
jgi:hypothetical protein